MRILIEHKILNLKKNFCIFLVNFYEPLGGAKGIGRSKIFQRNSLILIADLDSLQKIMNVKWFPFFYSRRISASKLARTADFRPVVHLLAKF